MHCFISTLDIDSKVCSKMLRHMESLVYAKELCEKIERIGNDNYKKIVNQYNYSLERLREQGKLPTPEQIVGSVKENKDFALNSLIEELEIN